MKNRNLAKILTLVLSLALLIGSVAAINVSAADENPVKAATIVHGAKIQIAVAVDDANAEVTYYWDDNTEDVKDANAAGTKNVEGTDYPVFTTEGVAYYDLAKVAHITVVSGGETYTVEYSVLQFLYAKLYRDRETITDAAAECYEALINLGTKSQAYLDDAVNSTPLENYTYVYTYVDGLYINGGKGYMAEGTANITITTDSTIVAYDGYRLIPKEGDSVDYAKSNPPATVSGVAEIALYTNECVDENTDGKCDDCFTYMFPENIDSYASANGLTVNNVGWNGTANQESSFSVVNTLSTGARPEGFTKGYWFDLTTNPTDAADRVIRYNMISTSTNWDTDSAYNSDSYLLFTPDEQVADGDLIVFQYDYYQNSGSTGKNPLSYYEVFANGNTSTGNKATYTWSVDTDGDGAKETGVRPAQASTSTSNMTGWVANQTWLTIRVVYSNTNQKSYYYVSTNGGASFDYLKAVSYAQESNLTQVGFYADYVWNCAATMYIDNVLCVKTNAATLGIELP